VQDSTALWETITSGSIWYRGMQNKKNDGELFWGYTSPALNDEGGITGFVAIKKGITDA